MWLTMDIQLTANQVRCGSRKATDRTFLYVIHVLNFKQDMLIILVQGMHHHDATSLDVVVYNTKFYLA